jgi:hypothetical protein
MYETPPRPLHRLDLDITATAKEMRRIRALIDKAYTPDGGYTQLRHPHDATSDLDTWWTRWANAERTLLALLAEKKALGYHTGTLSDYT